MVDEFIKTCDGLPLSLKIFSTHLYVKDDQFEWKNQLESLQQILPYEIQGRLKLGYDTMNEEGKHIFLDISCFSTGENRDTTCRIWNGSRWKGSLGFQNLIKKCLVELDNENNIHTHDHLRYLGREIVDDSNFQLCHQVFVGCRNCSSTNSFNT